MTDPLLVLNAGSSSIKFAAFPADRKPSQSDLLCKGEMAGLRRAEAATDSRVGTASAAQAGVGHRVHFVAKDGSGKPLAEKSLDEGTTHAGALRALLAWLGERFQGAKLAAVGHRVVHGGTRYTKPVRIDASVTAELRRLIPLAPLHQPHHLAAIDALTELHPALPQIACFDSAFHHTASALASAFALPRSLTDEGVRRYGFHGLSYEYIASVLPEVMGLPAADGRVVVAHLGAGASLCALRARKSVATTMGFTPLDGLPMARRCGSLDPGVVLFLMQEKGMSAEAISTLLYHESGLLGVSGISDDMRTLLASRDPRAAEAIALFVYRIGRELGSLAAALGGLDALVFTAGIGENAPEIRRRVCEDAAWLGVALDSAANDAHGPCITLPQSRVSAWVIPTDEDLMIARHAWGLLVGR